MSSFSFKQLDPEALSIVKDSCLYWRAGIKDIIDDPVGPRSDPDPIHEQCRREIAYRLRSVRYVVRGEEIRPCKYSLKEVGLFLDRSGPYISEVVGAYRGRFFSEAKQEAA